MAYATHMAYIIRQNGRSEIESTSSLGLLLWRVVLTFINRWWLMHLSWPSLYPTFTWSTFHYLIFMSCHCFQAHSTSLDFLAKVSIFRLLLVISLLVHFLTACAVIRGLNGQDLWFSSASLPCMEKAMAPYSSTLAWKIPRTEEPGGLQSMGLQGVRHNWLKQLSSSSSSSYHV